MAIVTISREFGSAGTSIATLLSEKLGCRVLDKRSVEEQMGDYDITRATVEAYDEKKPGFWKRISSDKIRYEHFLRGSILEAARAGSCVVLGRGGQVVLGAVPGVLRVRVTAPRETRIERIKHRFECDEEQAARTVQQRDQDRAGFHRFFFATRWDSLELYDIVVSTAKLSAEQVVQGIVNVTTHGTAAHSHADQQRVLIDRCLEMRVHAFLIYRERMTIPSLKVRAKNGVVTLSGQVLHEARIDQLSTLVSSLDDVEDVDNQLVHNHYPLIGPDYF